MAEKQLDDDEYNRIASYSKEEFDRLPQDVKDRYKETTDWHFGERQKVSFDGFMVGGKPYKEVLAEIRAAKNKDQPTSSS